MKSNFIKVLFLVSIIGIIAGGCSKKSEKSLFEEATNKINAENYPSAVASLEELTNDYPKGEYTAKAFFELGKIYHGKLIKELKPEESFAKAIFNYRQVFINFPKDPKAQNSMFMVGFIQANELAQLDSARATYNDFLKKYPEGELSKSAKAELDNLGVPAEEILKKNIENTK